MNISIKKLWCLTILTFSLPLVGKINRLKHPHFSDEKYTEVAQEIRKNIESDNTFPDKDEIYSTIECFKKAFIKPAKKYYGFDQNSAEHEEGKYLLKLADLWISVGMNKKVFDAFFCVQTIALLYQAIGEIFDFNLSDFLNIDSPEKEALMKQIAEAYNIPDLDALTGTEMTDLRLAWYIEISKVLEHF